MKLETIRPLLALACSLGFAAARAQSAGCITVEVQNVRPQQGQLMAAAYADAESFGKKPLAQIKLPAGDALTRFEFCGITADTIAITMFQDLDGDGRMARNPLGMPTEPWGSSGAPGAFGPSWDTGKVTLDGKPVVVRLSN